MHRTNASGTWQVEEIAPFDEDAGHGYGYPDIAIDGDGSMAIAYNRLHDLGELGYFPDGTIVATNFGNGWSAGRLIEDQTERPSIALRDGTVHAAFSGASGWEIDCGNPLAVRYATVTGDTMSVKTVSEDGAGAWLALAADGSARIVFSRWCVGQNDTPPVWYADGSSGSFAVEPVSWLFGQDYAVDLAIGPEGTVHLLFDRLSTVGYMRLTSDGWTPTVQLMPNVDEVALAVDDVGVVHVVAIVDGALIYATDQDGSLVVDPDPLAQLEPDSHVGLAIDVDSEGRPHVAYTSEGSGVFYLIGPGY